MKPTPQTQWQNSPAAIGRYRSDISVSSIPSRFGCVDCFDTGTATVTLWGVRDGDRYEQRDEPCHCPLGAPLADMVSV